MPNRLDPITGEIENNNAVATFDELQEWYNSTKEGRVLWKGDKEKWIDGFIRFYQAYGYVPIAGCSLFLRTDPNYALRNGRNFYINKSTDPNIVKEYGTVPSVPTWNTNIATGQLGQLNASLNGGCKVAQQLITADVNSATGEYNTSTVGGTAVGTLTLSDILTGSALGMGLGVAFTQFFPDQATDFSNFMLSPLINAGLLEQANYDDTRVGLMGVFKEHNDEQGNKLILPHAPYETIEKGLQYLLKIGAFNKSGNIIMSQIPVKGSKYTYSKIDIKNYLETLANDILPFSTVTVSNFMACYNTLIREYPELDEYDYPITLDISISLRSDNSPYQIGVSIRHLYDADLTFNNVLEKDNYYACYVKSRAIEYKGIYTFKNDSQENYKNIYDSSKIEQNVYIPYAITQTGTAYKYGHTSNVNNNYVINENVKGLQFTDYTPLINDINDLTARLKEWKNKNGWKVNVPSYDENGKPNGIREQWYLPLPTPTPSQKESGEYITPTQPYEETPVTPDSTPDIKKEITDKTKDLTDVLPENPGYTPKPTPPDDNTGTIEDSTSILGNNGQGLWSVYNPSLAQINEFGAWLWSNNIWEQIRQYFSDPMQGIIGLHKIYCKPTNGDTKTIIAGYLDSGVDSPIVTKQYERIDCGTMACGEYYGNALDYAPYTTVHIYLPFIGIVPLNVNEVMGSILHIFYDVDILTGACLATIEVKDSANVNTSLYQYNGICAVQVPLTSGNYGSVISSLVTTGAGIVATIASGGALAPVTLGGAVSALNSGAEIKQSGTIGANVGAMAKKKPYMIITRKIPHMPLNYNGLIGFPSNNRVYLSDLSGFVRTKKVYVSSLIATQNEKEMIEELLNDGVYV